MSDSKSWYLDPLVAKQKAAVNHGLVVRWADATRGGAVLKTDLFEEANGADHILDRLGALGSPVVGMDCVAQTVVRAHQQHSSSGVMMTVSDLRAMNFRDGTFDLGVSTSTLDHFRSRSEFIQSLEELARITKPGGTMILTLDNPWNLTYWPLRLLCYYVAPFSLGYTVTRRRLRKDMESLGLRTRGVDYVIHNPRMLSTLIFLAIRKALGKAADLPIAALIQLFEWIGKLPTKPLTACFSAICFEKR